jgi:CRISPR-associated endonuclease Cas2
MEKKKIKTEEKARRRRKRANIQDLILGAIAPVGIIGIALVAPNVLVAMKKLGLFPHPRQKESINASKDNLIKKKFLELRNGKLHITNKGKGYLSRNSFYKRIQDKKKKWDGRWRVLIFDIEEKERFVRDQIRNTLVAIGFMRLQNSVWIYPYDCEDLITLLKADLEVGKEVLYMIVEELEQDESIRSYFGFSKN